MNAESANIKNYLFIPNKKTNYAEDFKKFCINCTKLGHTVLFITRQPTDVLPLLSQLEDPGLKEQLKRLIIMYFECIEDVAKKLVELHDWALVPVLVVIDLNAFIMEHNVRTAADENLLLHHPALKSLCLCVAILFNYMKTVEQRLLKLKSDAKQTSSGPSAYSIVLLDKRSDIFTQKQLDLLINLYFYDEAAFDDFDEITNEISATW